MKNKRRCKQVVVAVAVLISLTGATLVSAKPNNGVDARAKVNSREFKILLKPELFVNLKDGFSKVSDIAIKTADETGAELVSLGVGQPIPLMAFTSKRDATTRTNQTTGRVENS